MLSFIGGVRLTFESLQADEKTQVVVVESLSRV